MTSVSHSRTSRRQGPLRWLDLNIVNGCLAAGDEIDRTDMPGTRNDEGNIASWSPPLSRGAVKRRVVVGVGTDGGSQDGIDRSMDSPVEGTGRNCRPVTGPPGGFGTHATPPVAVWLGLLRTGSGSPITSPGSWEIATVVPARTRLKGDGQVAPRTLLQQDGAAFASSVHPKEPGQIAFLCRI